MSRIKNPTQANSPLKSYPQNTGTVLRSSLVLSQVFIMVLAFSCSRPSGETRPDHSRIKIGYFGDLSGPTFN
ncbi:MAG TPA: hypothetical protein VIR01_09195, partial [Pyrinomonadaceae bacterium]